MMLDILTRYIFNIDTFHRFNFFLGTDSGELLRRIIELIFFGIIMYMIFSEYERNKRREYKYLLVGFFALFFRQLIMSTIFFSKVFSVVKFDRFSIIISFFDSYMESAALILLIGAFLFPAFKENTKLFQKRVVWSVSMLTLFVVLYYILFKMGIISYSNHAFLDLLKILILLTPFYIIKRGDYRKIRYSKSILLAFFVYLLIPFISLMSFVWLGYVDARLVVLQRPLPFLSIMLLTRAVYLKLVDKAFLKSQLKDSEERFMHEKEMNKLKDHFISIVSHELRTPITSVKLYLSLFKKEKFGKLSTKQMKAIETLANENDRLGDLITNLLTINRIEANKLVLEKEEFKINEIIDDLYLNIARDKEIMVENNVGSFKVNADRKMIKQVFINLINNAIKFSDKGSRIQINSGKKGNKWWLSVRDYGVGIPKSEMNKLFDKFYQVDNSLTRKNQGIGLGLAIVKNIVELHKGKIEVNSEVGKGAEFKIVIPF